MMYCKTLPVRILRLVSYEVPLGRTRGFGLLSLSHV